ncbi:methyltransferase family protein [Aminiphilus circumscriptus]|jgi:protein-S-isoprenylcysteine O-methyltransferase Ste14|uniref:methyltransferase family protein n=1 Tax=Aminiphilus circumscriptus TaxID=290732 RepID=UPI000492A7B2|nr:isoprenylcysteine carboxylmethyltransferase family protein [Aminiphilus circumscriptus]
MRKPSDVSVRASLGALAFRLRGGAWSLAYMVLLGLARPTLPSLLAGLVLVFFGQMLRFWGVGCIVRYRGEKVGAERLVTWGPFAFVRNPLYLGNGLIGLGWALAGNTHVGVVFFLLLFSLLYILLIIPHEECFLEDRFGVAFAAYRAKTGMLLPKRIPSREELQGTFDVSVLWRSERHSLYVTVLGSALILSRLWW